jgi:hypothetical protein
VFYRHQIFFPVCALVAGILSCLGAERFAVRVVHNVAHFVLRGPLSVRASDLLPRNTSLK